MSNANNIFTTLDLIAPLIPTPIYWLDLKCVIMGGNDLCPQAIGSNAISMREALVGKTYYDYYPKEIADDLTGLVKVVLETRKPTKTDERIMDVTTGKFRYYETGRAPLFDDSGELIGTICSAIEITDKKENEQLMIENAKHVIIAKQQEEFHQIVKQMVHDVNSPIATLSMILIACKELPENMRVNMREAVSRINGITGSVLNKYKKCAISNNEGELHEDLILSPILMQVIDEKKHQYLNKNIDFIYSCTKSVAFTFIKAQANALKRTLSNIINNSVDAIDDNDTKRAVIEILLLANGSEVSVIVKDNGKGMPEDVVQKILNNIEVSSGKADGHGIGMTQVQKTIKASNGKLTIESKVGSGTKVTLTFPQASVPEWAASKIELFDDDKIFVLDDDYSIHGAWDAKFKQDAPNIQIEHYTDGQEFMDFIATLDSSSRNKIFLLTDFELLKQKFNGLQIVELTGIERSILVTSHFASHDMRAQASKAKTKILPKQLASEISIVVNKCIL